MATATLELPTDLLHYQLRAARTMEDDSLAALGELAKAAKSADIKKMFRHHADETKEQIENLHKVFQLLELKDSTAPSPATKGISKQAEGMIGRSSSTLLDQVVLVDPETTFGDGIEGAVDRYVAMTRATQQLVVLTT